MREYSEDNLTFMAKETPGTLSEVILKNLIDTIDMTFALEIFGEHCNDNQLKIQTFEEFYSQHSEYILKNAVIQEGLCLGLYNCFEYEQEKVLNIFNDLNSKTKSQAIKNLISDLTT